MQKARVLSPAGLADRKTLSRDIKACDLGERQVLSYEGHRCPDAGAEVENRYPAVSQRLFRQVFPSQIADLVFRKICRLFSGYGNTGGMNRIVFLGESIEFCLIHSCVLRRIFARSKG